MVLKLIIVNNAIEEPPFVFQRSIQSKFSEYNHSFLIFHRQGSAAKNHSSMASISTAPFIFRIVGLISWSKFVRNFHVFRVGYDSWTGYAGRPANLS